MQTELSTQFSQLYSKMDNINASNSWLLISLFVDFEFHILPSEFITQFHSPILLLISETNFPLASTVDPRYLNFPTHFIFLPSSFFTEIISTALAFEPPHLHHDVHLEFLSFLHSSIVSLFLHHLVWLLWNFNAFALGSQESQFPHFHSSLFLGSVYLTCPRKVYL